MPAPRFQLSPNLLGNLAQGGGFQPGQAMLQGLQLRDQRKQQALDNSLQQRRLDIADTQLDLQEKKYESELERLKREFQEERARKEFLTSNPEDTSANRKRALALGLDPEKTFSQSADEEMEDDLRLHLAKKEIDQQFKEDEPKEYQKGGIALGPNGEKLPYVFDPEQGYVDAKNFKPLPDKYLPVPISAQTTTLGEITKGEAKEIRDRISATQTYVDVTNDALSLLEENPDANTYWGKIASVVNNVQAEFEAIADSTGFKYDPKILDPSNYAEQFDSLGIESARLRSMIVNLAFQRKLAAGESRATDKDIERFIQEVGASEGDPRAFAQILHDTADRTIRSTKNDFKIRNPKSELEWDFGLKENPFRNGMANREAPEVSGNTLIMPDGTQYRFPDEESANKALEELQ